MPWFVDFQKQYGPDGLTIVGVAMDDTDPQKIAQFASEMGVNYPVLLGTNKVSEAYGDVEYLPTTFYINRQGKIVGKVAGLSRQSQKSKRTSRRRSNRGQWQDGRRTLVGACPS